MTLGVWAGATDRGKTVGDHDWGKDQINLEVSIGFQTQIQVNF